MLGGHQLGRGLLVVVYYAAVARTENCLVPIDCFFVVFLGTAPFEKSSSFSNVTGAAKRFWGGADCRGGADSSIGGADGRRLVRFRGGESIQSSIPSENGSPFCQLAAVLELLSAISTTACTIATAYLSRRLLTYT